MKKFLFSFILCLLIAISPTISSALLLSPPPKMQFFSDLGKPLSGGKVYTYKKGTTTPQATYTTAAGTTANANPIILDSQGRANIWISRAPYSFLVYTSTGALQGSSGDIEIGVTYPELAATLADLKAITGQATGTTVSVLGRTAVYDGYQGTFIWSSADLSTSVTNDTYQGIYVPPNSAPTGVSGAWVRAHDDIFRPEYFITNTTPGTTDMTGAVIAAAGFAKTAKSVLYLSGIYGVSKVALVDAIDYSIKSDSAELKGIASTTQTAILELNNSYKFLIDGKLNINGNNNTNYTSGVNLITSAGGALGGNGAITRVAINNLTFVNCPVALKIGAYNVDTQVSELSFDGLNMIGCPGVVHQGGSQTVTSFTNSNLVSETNANFSAAPEYILRLEGGSVTVNGGEAILASGSIGTAAILLQPGSSATYSSPYGQFRFLGTLIEVGGTPLLQIENPRTIATPSSSQSKASFNNCVGFMGSVPTVTLMTVADTAYAGTISAHENNFYGGIGGSARTAYTIDALNTLAKIDIDKTSFGLGFLDWIGGVRGGVMIHELENYLYATNLNSQAINNGATAALVFITNKATGQNARGSVTYNAGNGTFVVPAGGAKRLHLSAYITPGTGALTSGIFKVSKDSADDVIGMVQATGASIEADYYDVPINTTFQVVFSNNSGGTVNFGTSALNKFQIFIEN